MVTQVIAISYASLGLRVFALGSLFYSLMPRDAHMRRWTITIVGSDNGLSPGRRQAII